MKIESAATIRTDLLKAFLEFGKMRPSPVNLATASATPELFVIDFGERLKLLHDVSLRYIL